MGKKVATIQQILKVTQHNDDIEFTVMCCDGIKRVFHDWGFTDIRPGYSFEYEDTENLVNLTFQ
jgi:hypothetical protein